MVEVKEKEVVKETELTVGLTKILKDVTGKTMTTTEQADLSESEWKTLGRPEITLIEAILEKVADADIKRNVTEFFKDYRIKTELRKKDVDVKEALRSIISSIAKPEVTDLIRMNGLLPKLDDDRESAKFTEREIKWLVKKMLAAEDRFIGSVVKARVLTELDPEGIYINEKE
jgi:hypothetical protein